jgi:putative endonuclease
MRNETTPNNTRRAAESRGRKGEQLAAFMLALKGYRVLGKRVRTPVGELDLVAKAPSGVICFIEVKARPDAAEAAEAVHPRQRERIARAASLYLAARPALRHKGVRFDAILIAPKRWPVHLKDAWRPEQ